MILLWGMPGDGPLDAVHASLRRLGADFRFLDQRDAARSSASLGVKGQRLRLVVEGPGRADHLDFEQVGAAYLRPVETERALPAALAADPLARSCAERVDRALIDWADLSSANVVNRPAAMAANNSKPYQLQLIAEHGFAVPDTLVTTEPDAVRAFASRHGRLIYKSVSGVRSIVNVVATDRLAGLDDVANVPTQFQEYVSGFDVRAHVVGDQVFATEVRSGAKDYRYASLSGSEVALAEFELPPRMAQRCCAMASRMGLAVAGIDLRCTPDGRWICFEVNPSPAFVYYEEATGQPIGAAIAHWLVDADSVHRGQRGKARSRRSVPASLPTPLSGA